MKLSREELVEALNQAIQRNGNQIVLFTNALAQKVGLSASEFECLSLLWERGPRTAGELGKLCGLSTGGVTGMVDRLEKAKFVRRKADNEDRRRVIIEPVVDDGRSKKISKLYEPVYMGFLKMTDKYSYEELKIIIRFLEDNNSFAEKLIESML